MVTRAATRPSQGNHAPLLKRDSRPLNPFLATRSSEIAFVRDQVPEFEFAFQEELRSEEGEMGPFQAMSLLASWVGAQLEPFEEAPSSVLRAFAAVERVFADHRFKLGGDLAIEFLDAICEHPAARASALVHMGARGRSWLMTFCPELKGGLRASEQRAERRGGYLARGSPPLSRAVAHGLRLTDRGVAVSRCLRR